MSKKKAEEIIEEVKELADDAQELLDEMDEPGIVLDWRVVEALLVQHDTSNRVGLTSVCEQIRQTAQEQDPEHFVRPAAKP